MVDYGFQTAEIKEKEPDKKPKYETETPIGEILTHHDFNILKSEIKDYIDTDMNGWNTKETTLQRIESVKEKVKISMDNLNRIEKLLKEDM